MAQHELQHEGLVWLAAQLRWDARLDQLRRSNNTLTEPDLPQDLAA